jgi:selenide,water dikinase
VLRRIEHVITLEPGEAAHVEWQIGGGVSVTGRLVDQSDEPIPGHTVWLLRNTLFGGRKANSCLVGHHDQDDIVARLDASVRDREIKFGFAVTGEIHPKRVVANAGAKKGDLLVLTKPLGIGILATALKRRLLPKATLALATRQMMQLNEAAAMAMQAEHATAATDISGFGLLGHALNIARASKKTIRVWSRAVPLLPGVLEFAASGVTPAGLHANAAYLAPETRYDEGVPEPLRMAFADPQTSGGLLIAVAPSRVKSLLSRLGRARIRAAVIGEVLARGAAPIEVAA